MISIVIPIYQCEDKISKIIEDILNQTYQDYEVLLVDDGSTDCSVNVCQEYEKKDSRIQVILNEHQGVSATRNTGISMAKGEYIAFIDADDRIEVDYLEQLYKNVKEYDLIISTFDRWFYRNGQRVKVIKNIQLSTDINIEKNFGKNFSKLYVSTLLGMVYCKLFRTDIIKKNNVAFRTDIYIGEDYIFNFDYLRNCSNILCIPYVGYHYVCQNENSLTQKKDLKKFEYGKILFEQSIKFADDMKLTIDESKGIYNLYLRTIFKMLELAYQTKNTMPKKERNLYILKIIQDEDTQLALKRANPDTKEFLIYKLILNTRMPFIIGIFSRVRLGYKKIVGRA